MTKTAGLLGSAIYKIQEAWTGWDVLQHANHVIGALAKGLKILLNGIPLRVPQSNGVSRHTPSQCPTML